MTQPAQTAYVQIIADFTGFARELETGVTKAFAQARPALTRAADTISKVLASAAHSGGTSLGELGRAGQHAATEIETELEAAARSGTDSMQDLSRSVSGAAAELGSDFARNGEQAEDSMREMARATDLSMDSVVHDAHRATAAVSGIGGAAKLAGTLLLGLATAATAGLGLLTTFGLKAAAAQEQTLISFESLLGSAQKGQAVFEQIRQFAAATPFELPQLTDVAKRFLTFSKTVGIAEDQLIPFLTTVGNVASVTGSGALGMERVALALGQIASKGKLSLEELNQISEGLPGFSGIAAIATAKGITTAEAMRQISAGTISAKDGVAALLKGMQQFPGAASAMEKQSQTLLGLFSTFKDEVTESLIGGFAPVIPDLKKTLADVTPIVKEAIAGLAPILGNLLAALGPLAAQLIRALNPILGPVIEGLRAGLEALSPALQPLGEALGHLAKAIAPILVPVGKLIAALATALIPIIDALVPLFEGLVPIVEQVGEALAPVLATLGESLAGVIAELVPVLLELLQAMVPLIPPSLRLVVALTPLVELLAELVQTLLVDTHLLDAFTLLMQEQAVVMNFAADAVAAFVGWLQQIDWEATGKAIGGFFTDLWRTITSFFGNLGAQIGAVPAKVTAAFGQFRDTVAARITAVVTLVASLPARIGAIMSGLAGQMFNAGANIIGNLINGIQSMAARLASTMADVIKRGVRDFLPFSPAKVGPLAGMGDPLLAGSKIVDRLAAGIAAATPALAGATGTAVDVHPGPVNVSVWVGEHELRGVVSSVVDDRNRQLRATVRSRSPSGTRPW